MTLEIVGVGLVFLFVAALFAAVALTERGFWTFIAACEWVDTRIVARYFKR